MFKGWQQIFYLESFIRNSPEDTKNNSSGLILLLNLCSCSLITLLELHQKLLKTFKSYCCMWVTFLHLSKHSQDNLSVSTLNYSSVKLCCSGFVFHYVNSWLLGAQGTTRCYFECLSEQQLRLGTLAMYCYEWLIQQTLTLPAVEQGVPQCTYQLTGSRTLH